MKKIIRTNIFMLKSIARYCPSQIVLSIGGSILASIMSVVSLLFQRYIINSLSIKGRLIHIALLIVLLAIINLGYGLLNTWLQLLVSPKNTKKLTEKMQTELFAKAQSIEYELYENSEFYDKFTQAMQQAESRALGVLNTFTSFVGSLTGIVALGTLIISVSPVLLLFAMIPAIFSFIINTRVYKIQSEQYIESTQPNRETGYAQRVFYMQEYAKEIRLFNGLGLILKNGYHSSIKKLLGLINKYGKKMLKLTNLQNVIGVLSSSTIMLYLARNVVLGIINIGDFVTMLSGSQQLLGKITSLLMVFPQLYEHSIYIDIFIEFMEYEPKSSSGVMPIPDNFDINLQNVSFQYPFSYDRALSNVTIKINHGEKIALVGPNGSGKSTIIKLLAHLYEPVAGSIFVNENQYGEYDTSALNERIGILFQDYRLYALTIAENILMRPYYPEDKLTVEKALSCVGLYDKVSSLENGIETKLFREFSNEGVIFSGGELQKIALARIYVKNPSVVILDEPSSALDVFSEHEVFSSVLTHMQDKTVIFSSHRFSNLIHADRIYYLKNGSVVESGTHQELIEKKGEYAEMFNLQRTYSEIDRIESNIN